MGFRPDARLRADFVAEGRDRFSADRCSMYVCDHEKSELWSLVALGLPDRFQVPFGKGISGTCADRGEVINVHKFPHRVA